MGQPVVHFEIAGNDVGKLQTFYTDLFGWKIDAHNPVNYGMVSADDNESGIGGGIAQMPDGQPGYATFYVEVPDVEAALAQADNLGGTRIMGPESPMEGLVIGMFTDPEGHIIGVVKSAS